ncbi:murein transglycosylase [Seiridium cupressi]
MAETTLTFRHATRNDTEILLPLIHSAYRGEERTGWTTEADLVGGDRIDTSGLVEKIEAPDSVILVVTDKQDALVACCEVLWRADQEAGYFGLFAVDPKRQGGGVGRQVLAYAEEYARQQWGACKMEMCVIWLREEIIAYYQRRGYRKTGEQRPFPHEYIARFNGKAFRNDLYFEVLVKDLAA